MQFTRRYFDPPAPVGPASTGSTSHPDTAAADAAPVYVYTDRIVIAVNVALATQRPLLIAGPPGSGKTTLARHIAQVNGWRYLQQVVTSRTQAEDLLYRVDALQRLNDAQVVGRDLLPDFAYVDPGVLWWAFDRDSASRRGAEPTDVAALGERFRAPRDPSVGPDVDGAVVLLDEIDKAEPDVPNDLLEPLDRGSFGVRTRSTPVSRKGKVLLIITTNGERELPPAFYRRCVLLTLGEINTARLLSIATLHFGTADSELHAVIADWFMRSADHARQKALRQPSTAEYLDTVRACMQLSETGTGRAVWEEVARLALWKHDERFDIGAEGSAAARVEINLA